MLWRIIAVIVSVLNAWSTASATPVFTARSFCDAFEGAETRQLFGEGRKIDKNSPEYLALIDREARASGQCRELLAASISNHRVKLEPKATSLCLKHLRDWLKETKVTSTLRTSMQQACNEAIIGQQQAGKACDSAFECVTGLVCIGERGGPPGACRLPLPINATCDDSQLNSSQLHGLIAASRSVCGPKAHCGLKNKTLVCLPN